MTEKVFWTDPYRTGLDTIVVAVAGRDIVLESTIFFAFSGGQESDEGLIGGFRVAAARKEGFDIVYTLAQDHGLTVGDPVQVEIDWERRYGLMRHHFAAELVLELIYRQLEGVKKIGAHIARDKARIDFAWPRSIGPLLAALEAAANEVVTADLAIETAFDDEANERRYWEIAGFSRVPCGGTHVRRTGEVGRISLKRKNTGRGKERVEIYLDR